MLIRNENYEKESFKYMLMQWYIKQVPKTFTIVTQN